MAGPAALPTLPRTPANEQLWQLAGISRCSVHQRQHRRARAERPRSRRPAENRAPAALRRRAVTGGWQSALARGGLGGGDLGLFWPVWRCWG